MQRASSFVLALALAACGGSGTEPASAASATAAERELSDAELVALRAEIEALRPGMSQLDVMGRLPTLSGLPVAGTGPATEATAVYVLGRRNMLWLTWNAADPANVWLRRAVVWNEATDPVTPALPYPPEPRPLP